ncbi:MAG TPA: N-6 DNA methylase [Humisphaera sp.]|nr:N-6 DNA methylase [Humisphaera sp.]
MARENREIVTSLQTARIMARAWSEKVAERQRQQAAWAFIKAAIDEYIAIIGERAQWRTRITPPSIAMNFHLNPAVVELARTVGREVTELPIEQACYQLNATYTALVPGGTRSKLGMYYTPPALSDRLLDMAEQAGISWRTARVFDPACGGGAFLLPVALRMREALAGLSDGEIVAQIAMRLRGFEIDPFAAWLTQTWLEIALADLLRGPLPQVVQVCDTLGQQPTGTLYDLVIGNPPYGRVSLDAEQRRYFARSLYGHANLYGVFTDIAMRWAQVGGVIAYVSPTSFLAGKYFKVLRSLLAKEAPPIAIDFIHARCGVFEDVLQEALLAIYRRDVGTHKATVHELTVASDVSATVSETGHLTLPDDPTQPWLLPREASHQTLIDRLATMPTRLADWGYVVSTGPLVWNRFKGQFRARPGKDIFPLVWAEAVTSDGRFIYRAEKRGHQPYFKICEGDEWVEGQSSLRACSADDRQGTGAPAHRCRNGLAFCEETWRGHCRKSFEYDSPACREQTACLFGRGCYVYEQCDCRQSVSVYQRKCRRFSVRT